MATTKAATLSIQKEAGYSALSKCAQTCVDRDNNNGDLEGHLKCGDLQILDSCFCKEGSRPKATTFLSSCIITKCKYTNQEVTSVLKLYDGYCDFKPTTTSATTTKKSTTTSTKSSSKTSSTATPAPSITPSSATSSAESSEISSFISSIQSTSESTSTEPTPTPTPEGITSASTSQAMGPGTIAGVAIGGIAAVFLAIAILMWFCRRGPKDPEPDPYFGQVRHTDAKGGAHNGGVFAPQAQHHDADATYVGGGGVHRRGVGTPDGSRGAESFDMGVMAARPTDFTRMNNVPGNNVYPMGVPRRKPVLVEVRGTGFRAELDAGRDAPGYRGEKG